MKCVIILSHRIGQPRSGAATQLCRGREAHTRERRVAENGGERDDGRGAGEGEESAGHGGERAKESETK